MYASTVVYNRNLNKEYIRPQFHTVMDDWFTYKSQMETDEDFKKLKNREIFSINWGWTPLMHFNLSFVGDKLALDMNGSPKMTLLNVTDIEIG